MLQRFNKLKTEDTDRNEGTAAQGKADKRKTLDGEEGKGETSRVELIFQLSDGLRTRLPLRRERSHTGINRENLGKLSAISMAKSPRLTP